MLASGITTSRKTDLYFGDDVVGTVTITLSVFGIKFGKFVPIRIALAIAG